MAAIVNEERKRACDAGRWETGKGNTMMRRKEGRAAAREVVRRIEGRG